MKRRTFMGKAFAGGALISLGQHQQVFASKKINKKHQFGVITNTIRKELQKDAEATLRKLAELGYRKIEFGSPTGMEKDRFKELLKELKLKPVAGGSSMSNLVEKWGEHVERCHEFGKEYLVCYWPFMDSGENKSLDDFRRIAGKFNELGAKAKKEGLRFAFHNHDKEFRITEGQIPYDILLAESDPDLVTMEIDLYWIRKGGQEPIPFFEKYPGRFELVHVKDMADDPEKSITSVGQGVIDFQAIFSKANLAGFKHLIVEEDSPDDGLSSVTHAMEHLKKLKI